MQAIHATFTTRKETCPPGQINNVQLNQKEEVKYLGLQLDRSLTLHKRIFGKRETTRNHPHQNVLVTRTQFKTLYKQQTSLIQSNTQTNLDLRNTILEYGFHIQHRNFGTFLIEDLAHDSGRTLVRAEYGYPKGSPNTNS
jgi:hypothetical protein